MNGLHKMLLIALLAFTTQTAYAVDLHDAYAPPAKYGPTLSLRAHLGTATYSISYEAVGSTKVIGEVTYINAKGKEVTEEFNGSITIKCGNVVAQPKVRFKGIPLGSAVKVTVK
jgi:hypothetical protein